MSKREALGADTNKNDRTNNTSAVLRKKIKVEHDFILSKAKKINESIDLTNHEVNKFLIIFHTLLDTVDLSSEISEVEETDGIVTDIILKIVLKITELIRQNIDSLPLPKILKGALKVINELFNGKKSTQDSRGGGGGGGSLETELKECTSTSSSSSSRSETTSSIDTSTAPTPSNKTSTTTSSIT